MPTEKEEPIGGMYAALRVLRTEQWAHFVALPLAPLARADLLAGPSVGRAALGVALTAGALGYAYGINAIGDRTSDASHRKNPLVGLARVPRSIEMIVASGAALALAAALPLGATGVGAALCSLVAATVYSVGPRAKAYPVLGLVVNTLIFLPLLYPCAPGSHPGLGSVTASFLGVLVQSQLVHELADSDEDEVGGDRTTAGRLGRRGVRTVCWLAAAFAGAGASALAPDPITRAVATMTLAAGALVVMLIDEPHAARRTHRRVAGLGGVATYLVGFFA